jgi:hypothetical protein
MLFGIIGIGMIIGGIIWSISLQNYKATAVETRAIVVDEIRETDPSDSSEYRYRYTLEYTVDGEKYTTAHVVGESPTMEVGEAIKIYYNPEDPEDFKMDRSAYIVALICIGAFCVLIDIASMIQSRRRSASQETQDPQQ